jgi:hypothetical protein
MNYQNHLAIARAIKDAQESFSPANRLAYHAAFYSITHFIANVLETENVDEFRRKVFFKCAGFDVITDDDRVRRQL